MFLKELDTGEFHSHISDPLFRHSDILFAKYPGLRELLAAELRRSDNQLKEIPEEGARNETSKSQIDDVDTKIVETFMETLSEPIMVMPQISQIPEISATTLVSDNFLSDKNDTPSDFDMKPMVEQPKLPNVAPAPKSEFLAKFISNEREITKNVLSLHSDNFDVTSNVALSGKYEQFRKWLADSTNEPNQELPTFAEVMGIDDSDVFSDSEEFLDAVEQTNPVIPSIQTVSVESDDHIYEALSNMPLSVSQLSASMASSSCRSSASDLTVDSSASRQRRTAHNKGQAPAPPSSSLFVPMTPQLTSNSIRVEAASEPKAITTPNNTVGKVPAVVEKEKKFRNFLNYIPNMLKPISPATSTKNLHIETDI